MTAGRYEERVSRARWLAADIAFQVRGTDPVSAEETVVAQGYGNDDDFDLIVRELSRLKDPT